MGNINNWIIGMVAIIGGCSILALLVKSCEKKSYSKYIADCISKAEILYLTSYNIKKAVLVLEQVSEDTIAAVIYSSYKDGKFWKQEIQSTRYRLSFCPEDVAKKILDKNCLIKTYY